MARSGRDPIELRLDRATLKMPFVSSGMVVGLFGGSFNPPHAGHVLVADTALRRLALDQLWWMVTPGNPLKKNGPPLAPLAERVARSQKLVDNPKIKVTAFEQAFGERHTVKVLKRIKALNPGVRFVWIMGADNLRSFHQWQDWRIIARTFPMAVIDRPGATLCYLSSKMAKTFDKARIDEDDAGGLAMLKPPAWTFIHGRRSPLSSTAMRSAQPKP